MSTIAHPTTDGTIPHLTPELWEEATRAIVAKALSELAHERVLEPRREQDGRYAVASDDGEVIYRFAARVRALEHWQIDRASLVRERRDGEELPLDALELVLDLASTLGLEGERLGIYLEEIASTTSALAYKLLVSVPADELAAADFQTIETRLTEGHPCFIANSGRLGFSAADYARYAPEAAQPVRLVWVAAHRSNAAFHTGEGLSYDELLEGELGAGAVERFARMLTDQGLDPDDYLLIPVHPWQWTERLAVTFAADVAQRRLVLLGAGDDGYLAQQSIRTFFNVDDPAKHYVKTALSVVNMGFVRGLSAKYMAGTPAINDWVAELVEGDPVLRDARFSVLRERAAVGYRPPRYSEVNDPNAPYPKMLAALWRETPAARLAPGERTATMASLLHVDRDGASLAAALIARSGLSAEAWVRQYLGAYLTPLLHCYFAHDLVFMPHGENLILVLEDDAVKRVFMKDIGEEIVLMDPARELPPEVERIRAEVPDELKPLSLLTDVVDCFFRFLAPILDEAGALAEDRFWALVRECVTDYARTAAPDPARVERELLCERFALSCLNRLQLRNSRQMVDLQDPAGSLQIHGTLPNPLARA
ncbi:MAG TPA: IucA/IucC family siderophore biosynthesis protein [Solirubrobacteraceae bacterium]|nr:IucA/IucC family siderophore biosynthesis protein [Solirubrobacteraceae bacterium]